ncbi:aspartyl/asparaginyl beta-hydroxylase domain-containing protein [Tenacibaculum sp. nBUS_03]|uniref:aspartyl/asparaginyl beta-hydroxylase domain-containing protein n=1 Tax=Tenacibaculum sp. nBUS_03 TaxID=3395320 RepID=UPI003EBDBA8E
MFYEINENFPFLLEIEEKWELIWNEIQVLGKKNFTDYEHSKDGGWKLMLLVMIDQFNEEYEKQCPITFELLRKIPNITFAAVSKLSAFSVIHPHKEWIKENDELLYNNGNLHRTHLGLKIPKDEKSCAIRVGKETRSWKQGKMLMFNDSMEHEVWNNTPEDRIVMVIDFIKVGQTMLDNSQIKLLKKTMIDLHM